MKSSKIFKLDNPTLYNKLAFDPHLNSLLLSGESLSMIAGNVKEDFKVFESLFVQPQSSTDNIPKPYLHFTPSSTPLVSISRSGLTLTCSAPSKKYNKSLLSQSFSSGIHYFEVICPISCNGIAFGVENSEAKKVRTLKLNTSTPRIVGVLLDLENWSFRLYTDRHFLNFVKDSPIGIGTWKPFIKIKHKNNTVTLNPFCSRYGEGINNEGYLYHELNSFGYMNMIAIKDLLEEEVKDDLEFLKGKIGREVVDKVKQYHVPKNKENKCTGIALLQFNSKEDEDYAMNKLKEKEVGKNMKFGRKLYGMIKNIKNIEKLKTLELIGVKYKFNGGNVIEELIPKDERKEITKEFKESISEYNEKLKKEYKRSVTNLLKMGNKDIKPLKAEISKSNDILPLYLAKTDNLILIKENMMKLLHRIDGKFKVPKTSFYNIPRNLHSVIGITLTRKEAKFLIENMRWRGLGEYLEGSSLDSGYRFLSAVVVSIEETEEEDVVVLSTYIDAKLTLNAAMEAISFEKLYRKLQSEQYKPCVRIFALTKDEDLNYLQSIFCKIEEILYCIGYTKYASKELIDLLNQDNTRINSAYVRFLTFQSNGDSVPSGEVLAEAGILRKEDGSLVHFESLSKGIDNGIYELHNKATESIWQELKNQFPDSKLLAGKISPNVSLSYSLNSCPPAILPAKISSIQEIPYYPLLAATCVDGSIGIYNTRFTLTCVLMDNFKSSFKEVVTSYKNAKLETELPIDLVFPETDSELGLLFSGLENLEVASKEVKAVEGEGLTQKNVNEVAEVFNPMVIFNEESASLTCPLIIVGIVKEEETGKYFLRVRRYGYFTNFLKYSLREDKEKYVMTFDGTVFGCKDRPKALSYLWNYIVTNTYNLKDFGDKGIIGTINEQNYLLEGIKPQYAYTIITKDTTYCIKVFYLKYNNEVMVNTYDLISTKNLFILGNTKSMNVMSKKIQIKENERSIAISHNGGISLFDKNTLELINTFEVKSKMIELQNESIIVQDEDKVYLHSLNHTELEVREAAVTINELDKDVKAEDLNLNDILAYANIGKVKGLPLYPKESQAVLNRTLLAESGTSIRSTWNIVGKNQSHTFEFDIAKSKDPETLDLTLEFTKDSLNKNEETKILKAITAQQIFEYERQVSDTESHLPLIAVWTKGSSSNYNVTLSNLFEPNKTFCSNYPQPAFIFAHQHNKAFLIKKCIVRSGLEAEGKSFPIGAGLIYTGNYIGAFRDVKHDFVTKEEYSTWLTKRRQCKMELQPYEPAGFFQMDEKEELSFSLDFERPCRYIYFKPTNFRTKPTKMSQFTSFPMSMKYFGVAGVILEQSDSSVQAWNDYIDISEAKINTETICDIEGFSKSQNTWRLIKSIKDIELQKLYVEDVIAVMDKETSYNKQQALWHLECDELSELKAKKYRIKVVSGKEWKLSSVSTMVYPTRRIETESKILKNVACSYLWRCRNDPVLFNKVNKALCDLICNPERDYYERIEAIGILKNAIETSPKQIELIADNIDLDKFIKANIYQSQIESFGISLLTSLQVCPSFAIRLSDFAKNELNQIQTNVLPFSALSGFNFVLSLALNTSSEKLLQQILLKIYEIATKYMSNLMTEEQILLHTRLNVNSYPLSPTVWAAPNSKEGVSKFFRDKGKKPASKRFAGKYRRKDINLVLDCGELYNLTEAAIYFRKAQQGLSARLNIKVFGVEESERNVLISEKEYSLHVWERITSGAYNLNKTEYNENDELEALKIPLGFFVSRYVLIQITLKKTQSSMKHAFDVNKMYKNSVIAELYGSPQGKKGAAIPKYDDLFKKAEAKNTDKKIGHSGNYEESMKGDMVIYNLKGITSTEEKKREENVEGKVQNLQGQLKTEINKYKEGLTSKSNIINIVNQIETLQRIQCYKHNSIEGNKCLEYLTYICLELANIVTTAIEKNKFVQAIFKTQTSCNLLALSKVLFRNFVAFNSSIPRLTILNFIHNILLQDATETDKVKFILETMDEFLSQSKAYYSQKVIIECLGQFQIPEGEVLTHLANKLKVSNEVSISQDQSDHFALLTSSLTLAIRSLRKLPVIDPEMPVHYWTVCNSCKTSPIVGTRLKCGHCSNCDVCPKPLCIKKHEEEFPEHVFISIPKPLPYEPTKIVEGNYKPLLPPIVIEHGTNVHKGVECDNCGSSPIKGIRYLCANCDYFNLCSECYIKNKSSHYKTHVFLRLVEPILQSETSTPKALIVHLDPALYPSQSKHTEPLKRSLSVISESDAEELTKSLDIDKGFRAAYKICVWVCTNNTMESDCKALCLKLCSELLCILLKLGRLESVDKILSNYGELCTIINSYLKAGDEVMEGLVNLITEMREVNIKIRSDEEIKEMSKEDRRNYLEKVGKVLNIRINLSSSLYQILKSVIEIVSKNQNSSLNNFVSLLDSYVGILTSISQIEDILKNYNVAKNNEEDLVLPEMSRSLSVPTTEQKHQKPQYASPSLQFVSSLIVLLESFTTNSGTTYERMWEILLKIILKMQTEQLVEAKLFERIINSFFKSSPDIQTTIYRKVLDISGNMVNHKNICSLLINLIRSTLISSINTTHEEIAFYMCRGWLDIFITGKPYEEMNKTVKDLFGGDVPESEVKEEGVKEEKIFAKFEKGEILDLLYLVSEHLYKNFNYGSYKGCVGGDYKLAYRSTLALYMIKILTQAKTGTELAIKELISSCQDKKLFESFIKLLYWLFLNYYKGDKTSHILLRVYKISKRVKELFKYVHLNEELCKHLLSEVKEIVKVTDSTIVQRLESREIQISFSILATKRLNFLLKKVIRCMIMTPALSNYFAFELKGFDFLVERLGIASTPKEGHKTSKALESDVIEMAKSTLTCPIRAEGKANQPTKSTTDKFSTRIVGKEDFGRDITVLECSAESNITTTKHLNWCRHKLGLKYKAYIMNLKEGSKDEVVLTIELLKLIEIQEMQFSFIKYWGTDDIDNIDISSVIVETSADNTKYEYLCTLNKVYDKSVESHGTIIFGKNLESYGDIVGDGNIIKQKLRTLKNTKVKFMKFIIRTGVKVSFCGTQASKSFKKKAIAINYLSIMGYDLCELPYVQTYIKSKNQETSYEILNTFQLKIFKSYIEDFNDTHPIITQLKTNFRSLMSLINPNKPTIEPFLVSLCSYNAELSKWLLQELRELMMVELKEGYGIFMIQIALSNPSNLPKTQRLILSFLLDDIKKLNQGEDNKTKVAKNMSQFVMHYISLLDLSSFLLKNPIELKISEEEIKMILNQILKNWDNNQIKETLIKLLITILRPSDMIKSNIDLRQFLITHFNKPKTAPLQLLLSLFVQPFTDLAKELLTTVPDELPMSQKQAVSNYLELLLNLTLNPEVRYIMTKNSYALNLYNNLKDKGSIIRLAHTVPEDLMYLMKEIIQRITLGDTKMEEKLAKAMIDDLILLKVVKRRSALSKLILDVVRAEITIPVCLYPFDVDSEQCKSLMHNEYLDDKGRDSFFLNTKILNTKYKEALMSKLKQRFDDEATAEQLFASNWKLIYKEQNAPVQGNSTKFRQFFRTISDKGPFLLLLSGEGEGRRIVAGGFNIDPFPMMPDGFQTGQQYKIKSGPESMYFYYINNELYHFELKNKTDNFGTIYVDYSNGGACLLGGYFITYSFSTSYNNNIGNPSSMKCLDGSLTSIPHSFSMNSIEIWAVDKEKPASSDVSDKVMVTPLGKIRPVEHIWYLEKSPYSYLRSNAVFHIPAHITVKELRECLIGKEGINITLKQSAKGVKEEEIMSELHKDNAKDEILDLKVEMSKSTKKILSNVGYVPKMAMLEYFEKFGGYTALMEAAKASLSEWKNEKIRNKMQSYLEEVMQFSSLSNFLKVFISNKKCCNLLFEIMAGTPDKETTGNNTKKIEMKERKWENKQSEAVTFCFSTVSQLFADLTNVELRLEAIKSGTLEIILKGLNRLSNEKPRKWHDEIKEENIKAIPILAQQKPIEKKLEKKGVGYSTQIGEIWDVDKYIKSKETKNQQITSLIAIISNFISCEKWEPDDSFIKCICESSLLPLLESSLACSSILELAKECDLIESYLSLIEKFCSKSSFAPLLLLLDPHYLPKQHQPLHELLKKLDELSAIFVRCMNKEADIKIKTEAPIKLADHIHRCYERVKKVVKEAHKDKQSEEIKGILSLPLDQAYKLLLKDLRFGYTNMRDDKGKYKHFYHSHAFQEKTASKEKLIRLAQELADLSNSLPAEYTNAIFIRVDDERIDYMKVIIMGACNTPYAHGAFEYDIYCPKNYPNESPKMNLCTTGKGAIRFNPNLYHDGKVCLSLLGTWRGTATENWDSKLSSILQILMSLQAIVMSEEVYFNEPGFEGELGKPIGDKKNRGYCNIVRYGNIKYAMTDQIKNPPQGFESVIRRHFYIKKNEILKDVHKWIEHADTQEALYEGLVRDHNSTLANKFKTSKDEYKNMLTEAVKELEQALNDLQPPEGLEDKVIESSSKNKKEEEKKILVEKMIEMESVDVSEDTAEEVAKKTAEKTSKLNIEDAGVKDRWSRYIGAIGIEAVAKQAKSLVFLNGANALGIEIAKNIVLSGCKEFVIQDDKQATQMDLAGQFYLTEADIGKNRAEASVNRLQQLNYYVKVNSMKTSLPTTEEELDKMNFNKYTVIILTECNYKTQIIIDEYCRKKKIHLVVVDVKGVLCKLINDFGNEFEVLDTDGEEAKECMLKEITNEENGLVTTITGQRHGFSNGDTIVLQEVDGMKSANSDINGTLHIIKFVDPFKFRIGDTRNYSKYIRNGVARQVKVKKTVNFKSLKEIYNSKEPPYDKNLLNLDFTKIEDIPLTHHIFNALNQFEEEHKRLPNEWSKEDANILVQLIKSNKSLTNNDIEFITKASYIAKTSFSPLCALMGGIAAQEAIKAITGKYTPINQLMYYHVQELISSTKPNDLKNDRYLSVKTVLGNEVFTKMADWKAFMVGVGAIGCELLKNYALLGFGSNNGGIVLTDPDVIEVSNLNRQFLFKEKHIRKPKSFTAAAAVLQMNPTLKGKVSARTDKVSEDTSNVYNDKFFEVLNVVMNALDNVQARRYIDSRCVTNKIPLLESGTLGSKGHVQVIIPYKTESYSSQNDPEEETNIPVCTLKMFPEDPSHCIEWARDKFEKIFVQKPKNLQKFVNELNTDPGGQDSKMAADALKWIRKMPRNYNDCIKYAIKKFKKYFENDVKQLLYVYPIDAKDKNGQPFWTLPKRPPHEVSFDSDNPLHVDFVIAVGSLFARVWGLEVPKNIKEEEVKKSYGIAASMITLPKYAPDESKAKDIMKEVEDNKEITVETSSIEQLTVELIDEMENKITEMVTSDLSIKPESFEKDDDTNFHIDYIYAMANCRAACYGIKAISWMDTKIKAGRIVPALSTTTSVVAALQILELIKLVKSVDVEVHRNVFVNLALPLFNFTQPGSPQITKLTDNLKVTIWDRWDVKLAKGDEATFGELIDTLRKTYSLEPKNVFKGNKPIYMSETMSLPGNADDKKLMASKLKSVLHLTGNESYIDLTIAFVKLGDKDLLNNVPPVRLLLK